MNPRGFSGQLVNKFTTYVLLLPRLGHVTQTFFHDIMGFTDELSIFAVDSDTKLRL